MDKIIQETDVERRNLMTMSLLIIIFNLADGTVKDDILTLPLISIQFHNPHALVVIAWTILGWFTWRFWQRHGMIFIKKIKEYISGHYNRKFIYAYLETKLGKNLMEKEGKITNPFYNAGNIIRYNERNDEDPYKNMEQKEMYMSGISFNIFRIKNHLHAYINSDAITSYLMPYIFAFLAVLSIWIKI